MLETAERIAGGAVAARAIEALPRAINKLAVQRAWLWGVGTGALFVSAVAGAYWLGGRNGYVKGAAESVRLEASLGKALARDDARQWDYLLRFNDLATTPRTCVAVNGREVCTFALWVGPAPPPAETQQQTKQAGKH